MEDWKERLIIEQKELKEKLIKLTEFVNRACDLATPEIRVVQP